MEGPGRDGRSTVWIDVVHVAALYALAGDEKMDDFFRRLKANGVRIVDGNSVVRDLVARGEVKAGLTDTDDVNVAIENGQPIGMVLPDREGLGVPVMPNMVSLIANAPHAAEAREAHRLPVICQMSSVNSHNRRRCRFRFTRVCLVQRTFRPSILSSR